MLRVYWYYVRIVSDEHRDLERQAQKMQAGIPRHEPLERRILKYTNFAAEKKKFPLLAPRSKK